MYCIGSVVMALSSDRMPRYSAMERVFASIFRPDCRTSLGLPVLPEVVSRRASSSGSL